MTMDPSYELLGIRVHAMTIADLNARIARCIESNDRAIIANHNLHSACLVRKHPAMAGFYEKAKWTHIDGMPLVYFGRLLRLPLRREHRVTYVDWLAPLMAQAAARHWRIYHLGCKPGVAEKAADILRKKYLGLQLETHHGYFDAARQSSENEKILAAINQHQPHILMVGMGMPKQELWIADHLERISANVILPCGATMDYIAGEVPTPPRWMGQWGLEWLYRLCAEPRRLWHRYMVEPWILFIPACRDVLRRIAGLFKRKPRH